MIKLTKEEIKDIYNQGPEDLYFFFQWLKNREGLSFNNDLEEIRWQHGVILSNKENFKISLYGFLYYIKVSYGFKTLFSYMSK